MKRMRLALAAIAMPALLLSAACSSNTASSPSAGSGAVATAPAAGAASEWQMAVTTIQVAWPLAKVALATEFTTQSPAMVKAEALIDADVAALAGTTAPTNTKAVLADVQLLVAAVPTTSLSASHQADIQALLAGAQAIANF